MLKYVCSNNPNHKFDKMTADGFCPEPECYGIGFLVEINPIVPEPKSDPDGPVPNPIPSSVIKEIGLCILVMDASGSMKSHAFPNSPAIKEHLIAGSAAGGIFDLAQTTNLDSAYVCGIMFDTDNKLIFMESVEDILKKYSNPGKFANFLKSKFRDLHGGTDINKALRFAKEIYDDFVNNGDLSRCNGPTGVKPIMHTVFDRNNKKKIVPNIRVLIYTDGMHTESSKLINPFINKDADVLLGAYFGPGEEVGCKALRKIISKCPKHDFEQFFLINDPRRIQTLRHLFRMASGASGFCPMCLADTEIIGKTAESFAEVLFDLD